MVICGDSAMMYTIFYIVLKTPRVLSLYDTILMRALNKSFNI